uniref:F-box domain-containing protein n=1 Tax=Caenorhabditis tropicalis TaxID=1561998 RepID=A0A1I7V247_9PELO
MDAKLNLDLYEITSSMSDLSSSDSIDLITPESQTNFWKDLPPAFQKEVVKKLDYKSRCCLRKSSKTNRDLVDACPLIMSYITMKTDRIYNPKTKQLDEQVVFSVFADNWRSVNLHGIDDLLSLFRNRRSVAQSFWFDYFDESKPCVTKFLEDLERELKKRGTSSKLRARKIQWNNAKTPTKGKVTAASPDPGVHVLNVLKCFDAKFLKSLDIVKSNFTSSTIRNQLGISSKTMIDLFLTAEKLKFTAQTFTAQEIWRVIESFQTRDLPRGSHFQLTAHKPWDLEDVLGSFPGPIRDEPIGVGRNPFIKHTQRFKTRDTENVLVVKFNSETVRGVVCRADYVEQDYGRDTQ